MYTLYGHEGATLSTAFSPKGDFFASGGADKQSMIWRAPLEDFKGEVIQGLNPNNTKSNNYSINNPCNDKNMDMDWSQSLQASLMQGGMNNSMNYVNMNQSEVGMGQSLVRFDSAEENMMVMDKVMGTLDQIVEQLDTMNNGLKHMEQRVGNLEDRKKNNHK